ncbi:hypothetical protein [Amycolatopsis sp. NPDC003731]
MLTAEVVGELVQLSPRMLKDQAAARVLPHHRFGKRYRFTRGDVTEIVRLSAAPVKPPRRRDGETRFDDFAEEWLAAVAPRLELNTVAKYRSFLDTQLLPQWKAWPLIAIFNGYVETERWLSELHEDYAESSVSAYFALFSTILNAAVRARMISPTRAAVSACPRVSSTPSGWSPRRRRPRCGSTSWGWGWGCRGWCCAQLMDSHRDRSCCARRKGHPWRRSNFRIRFWRPAWDGAELDDAKAGERRPPILPTFTFHEGRHTHSTWVYDHLTPAMVKQILDALGERWLRSLAALYPSERAKLVSWFPHLRSRRLDPGPGTHRHLTTEAPPLRGGTGLLTCENLWCAILGLNQ